MSDCDWNPDVNRPALMGEESHAQATLSVGASSNNWHLCASCAALPRFKAFKKRPLRER